jgi:hypothetical protein
VIWLTTENWIKMVNLLEDIPEEPVTSLWKVLIGLFKTPLLLKV